MQTKTKQRNAGVNRCYKPNGPNKCIYRTSHPNTEDYPFSLHLMELPPNCTTNLGTKKISKDTRKLK